MADKKVKRSIKNTDSYPPVEKAKSVYDNRRTVEVVYTGKKIDLLNKSKPEDKKEVAAAPEDGSSSTWWIRDSNFVHQSVFARCLNLLQYWMPNYRELSEAKGRYEDSYYGYGSGSFSNLYAQRLRNDQLSLNITASCIDTLASKISKNIPQIKYVSSSSDYIVKDKALQLEKFVHGHFQYTGAYNLAVEAFIDCLKYGTGFIHMYRVDNSVRYEVIKPFEIVVDFLDGATSGNPVDIHIRKVVNRYEVARRFPEHKESIMAALASNVGLSSNNVPNRDNIQVIESYHRYGKRHTICIDNCTLLDEKWEFRDKNGEVQHPISIIRFKDADRNFFGIGLGHELRSIQLQLNDMMYNIQRAWYLMSVPKVYVHESSGILKSQLNNDLGGIITYSGAIPPTPGVLGIVPPDLLNGIVMLWGKGFEVAGLSQLTAASQLPPGLQQASGKAMETYYQIESDRFNTVGQRFENLISDMNEKTVLMMKYMESIGCDVGNSVYYSTDLSKSIKWSEVYLEREQYDLQHYPVNQLPNTPAGRFSFVQDLMGSQLIDRQAALKLLKLPDTEDYLNMETASEDLIDKQISLMMRGEDVEPMIFQDFDLAQKKVRNALNYYACNEANPDGLHRLNNFLVSLDRISLYKQAQTEILLESARQQAAQDMANNQPQPTNDQPSAITGQQLV